jgi:hypothetical protein
MAGALLPHLPNERSLIDISQRRSRRLALHPAIHLSHSRF